MLHFNDMMGTVREDLSTVGFAKVEGTGTPNGYVVTTDSESLGLTQPQPFNIENHIQFHGGIQKRVKPLESVYLEIYNAYGKNRPIFLV